MVRAHVFITGLVQGVFFRMYTQREAQALGLSGWVRNVYSEKLPVRRIRQAHRKQAQGKQVKNSKLDEFTGVEAVFEGEKKAVNEMISWCWSGSPSAKVTDVRVEWEEPRGLRKFETRR
jgi:acylphosphatase